MWFEDYFGFKEGSSYSANRDEFKMEGEHLVCGKSRFPRQYVGPFSCPSLRELKELNTLIGEDPTDPRVQAVLGEVDTSTSSTGSLSMDTLEMGPLTFRHEAHPVGVEPLFFAPQNTGAVFQAASQFNALEVSPARDQTRTINTNN